jgi:transcriptional repressor NrdR
VVKRSGVTEPFSREKVVTGVRRACRGRPVDEDAPQYADSPQQTAVAARAAGPRSLDAECIDRFSPGRR